jgi:hypothetical protein
MTQPSNLDSVFSQSSLLFPSRSSPFVCLFDALDALISLGIHVFRGNSLRRSALLVNWQRARDRLGRNVEELEDVPAEKHPIAFGILFIVTVLQAVKIFAFQGLIWTKVWGGLYLSSYLVLALVGFLAPKDWRDDPPEVESRERFQTRMALMGLLLLSLLLTHFIFCCLILDLTFWDAEGQPLWYWIVPGLVQAWITMFILAFIISLSAFAPFALWFALCWVIRRLLGRELRIRIPWSEHWTWPDPRTRSGYCLQVFGYFMIGSAFMLYLVISLQISFLFIALRFRTVFERTTTGVYYMLLRGASNLFLFIGALRLLRSTFIGLTEGLSTFERFNSRLKSHGVLIAFACWNFLQALLYYCLRYDPYGTIKPSWTDKLG